MVPGNQPPRLVNWKFTNEGRVSCWMSRACYVCEVVLKDQVFQLHTWPFFLFFRCTFVPSIAYREKWLVLYLKFEVTLRSCILSGKPVQRTGGFTSSIYVYWLICACELLNVLTISPLQKTSRHFAFKNAPFMGLEGTVISHKEGIGNLIWLESSLSCVTLC